MMSESLPLGVGCSHWETDPAPVSTMLSDRECGRRAQHSSGSVVGEGL